MAEYNDTDSGVLFSNDKKSEKAPDYTGKFNYNGKEFKLAGWKRTSAKTGKVFLSLKVDTYEPEPKGKDSEAWQTARDKFKREDVTDTEDYDRPINMSDIPF